MNANASESEGLVGASAIEAEVKHELAHLKKNWWWFLLLGALLVLGGIVAVAYPFLSSVSVVVVFGTVLMVGGLATVIGSFWTGKWSAFLLQLLVGILYTVAGIAITDAPVESTLALTLVIASLFIIVGIFRIVAALMIQFPQWGWALLNGGVTLLLGVLIYRHFPESSLWVIGVLVGIELLFNGWTWIMLALSVRNAQDVEASAA